MYSTPFSQQSAVADMGPMEYYSEACYPTSSAIVAAIRVVVILLCITGCKTRNI